MIVDSLRYWVETMHVDGFRFDLASILARDASGQLIPNPPVLWDIESDPVLAGTKLIAEAWDAAGLYQVGSFVGDSWKEWNGRFRDDVRSFFRGEDGIVERFADRLIGSPSLYDHKQREPEASVNFVTCHDGFTLNDLVSYDRKHNEAERRRQPGRHRRQPELELWRRRTDATIPRSRSCERGRSRTSSSVTMLSAGMPMMLMGDEVRRTQDGNNNAYCQDNETSWFDWTLLAEHADMHRFVSLLNRRRSAPRHRTSSLTECALSQLIRQAHVTWHGVKLYEPDWSPSSHSIACTWRFTHRRMLFHAIFNAYWEPLEFELPPVVDSAQVQWRRWIDTSLDSPHDIVECEQDAPTIERIHLSRGAALRRHAVRTARCEGSPTALIDSRSIRSNAMARRLCSPRSGICRWCATSWLSRRDDEAA